MNDLMREEFEKEWGFTNEEQGLRFIPKLNVYGSDLYLNSGIADRKSSAWFYFQKGWKASRESLVVKLPKARDYYGGSSECLEGYDIDEVVDAIEAAGVKTK